MKDFALDSRSLGDILERAILFVVQKKYTPSETYGEIGITVIVIIAGRAANSMQRRIDASLLGYVFELAVAQIVIQRHPAFLAVVRQKDIDAAVVVIIKKTCAGPEVRSKILRGCGRGFRQ